jgi:SAM-dependent methyltransferase
VDPDEYTRTNRTTWDERVAAHAASPDYAVDRLVGEPDRVSDVVAFDRERIGPVEGASLLHLQCHIGTDTVSWGKLGARVTGLDFSPAALEVARDLAARCGLDDARFVEATVDGAPTALSGETFDVVYTGVGALCWLPDVARWAEVVASLLAPGGRLFLREGHPVLWAMEWERDDDLLVLGLPYFEQAEPSRWDEGGTYVEVPEGTTFSSTVSYDWNHGLGEILSAVLGAGLVIERFEEHREVPWRPFDLFERSSDHPGEWVLPARHRELAPMTYTLVARRP